jgi:hypothetical protein
MFTLNGRVIVGALVVLFHAKITLAQGFTFTGDTVADKTNWLLQAPPQIEISPSCPVPPISPKTGQPINAEIGGVAWPTLVQIQKFLTGFTERSYVCISGGSEPGHCPDGPNCKADSSGRTHANGFKVDLQIENKGDTFSDTLSKFIIDDTFPYRCRDDNSPQYLEDLRGENYGLLFAMEHPSAGADDPCEKQYKTGPHWDILSSYSSLTVTPPAIAVDVADFRPVFPVANDSSGAIAKDPGMFDYCFPQDLSETIATVDRTGSLTGTAGAVIGVRCDAPPCSTALLVSEGAYYDLINVTVNAPDPPNDGPICPQGATTSGCWQWLGTTWSWNPPPPSTPTPDPPALPPPPFGVCPQGSQPCWQWDPTGGNGDGGWIFVLPEGDSSTSTSQPIIPAESVDPNAISGPTGVGAARYISGVSPAGYTVYFENDPTATAAADQIVVTDQVDLTRFDLTTLTLGPITFPGSPGVLPPSVPLQTAGQFSTQVSLTTANLLVNVTASLNSTTGLLTWTLRAIDPNTGLPPEDPALGILPPGGNGSVSYTARLLPSLRTGTVINDQATVTFDANAPIPTAVWSNTLDATPPISRVNALPSTEPAASFLVSWSGTDVGSGIQGYTIYVSDSGGPYSKWLTQTPSTSAKFIGNIGHTYFFYSAATDLAGNTEAAKAAPDTSTTVTVPCAADSSASAAITRGGFRLNHATGQFTQTVTIQNKSAAAIGGPISLVFDNLSSNASLTDGTGITACKAPLNSEFVNLSLGASGSLAPGKSNTVTLTFADPSQAGITYSTRVLAGAGVR